MTIFLLSLVIISFLVAAMAIGVLMGKEPIKGSCGGMSALGLDTECDICGGDPNKCDSENEQADAPAPSLAYNAAQTPPAK